MEGGRASTVRKYIFLSEVTGKTGPVLIRGPAFFIHPSRRITPSAGLSHQTVGRFVDRADQVIGGRRQHFFLRDQHQVIAEIADERD